MFSVACPTCRCVEMPRLRYIGSAENPPMTCFQERRPRAEATGGGHMLSRQSEARRPSSFFRRPQVMTGSLEDGKLPLWIRRHYQPSRVAHQCYCILRWQPFFTVEELAVANVCLFLLLYKRYLRNITGYVIAISLPYKSAGPILSCVFSRRRCGQIISMASRPRAPPQSKGDWQEPRFVCQCCKLSTLVVLIILTNASCCL